MYEDEEDEDLHIDFTFDGANFSGPTAPKKQRKVIGILRKLVEDVKDGGEFTPLESKIASLYQNVDKAILQCQREAAREPDRAAFYASNIDAYNQIMDALELMDEGIENDDMRDLEVGLEDFIAGVRIVDELVEEAKAEMASQS